MKNYTIPTRVSVDDAREFKARWQEFQSGELTHEQFEKIRVPFGIYEQRTPKTYMTRVKTYSGGIGTRQFIQLAKLSERFANSELHLTTRACLQLHFVKDADFIELEDEIAKISLTTRGACGDNVRGVIADELAGIAKDEAFDVLPYANEITSRMIGRVDSYGMSRKFKIAFSGSKADRGVATITCAGFIAKIKNGKRGFNVYVAGGMGSKPRLGDKFRDFIPANEAFLYAQAIKLTFKKYGDYERRASARLRHVAAKYGKEELFKFIEHELEILNKDKASHLLPPLKSHVRLSKPKANVVRFSDEQKAWMKRFVKPQKQKGYYYITVPFLWGNISSKDAIKLGNELLRLNKKDSLSVTKEQLLLIKHLTKRDIKALYPTIMEISPLSKDPYLFAKMTPCTGAATCRLGICRPRGAVKAAHEFFRQTKLSYDTLNEVKINLSGCPNSCTRHLSVDIGFFGGTRRQDGHSLPTYTVVLGGATKDGGARFGEKAGIIAAKNLPQFLYETLKAYENQKSNFKNFTHWVDNGGLEIASELTQKYINVANFDESRDGFIDFGADFLFEEGLKSK